MIFRLHTQRCKGLADLVSKRFPAFTTYDTQGYWMGKPEDGTMVEIITTERVDTEKDVRSDVYALAHDIIKIDGQDSVLVTELAGSVNTVTQLVTD